MRVFRLPAATAAPANCYAGPGVFLRNGRLEIRLEHDPNDLRSHDGTPIAPIPRDPNPNHHSIIVDANRMTLYIVDASYLTIRNITFHQGDWRTVEVDGASHHIEFDGCTVRARSYGLLCRENVRDIEIHHCVFDNGLADWFRWGDVKVGCKPFEHYNNFMVAMGGEGHYLHHNTWRNCFINLSIGQRNVRVTDNLFIRPHETFFISPNVENIEIARNIIRHGMEAFARVPRNSTLNGVTFIHHNIVDLSAIRRVERQGNFGEFNRVWTAGWAIWGSHGCDERCNQSNWMIYNNTFICRSGRLRSWGANHREYNNIFYQAGSQPILPFQGADAAGNVVWRTQGQSTITEPGGLATDPLFDTAAFMAQRYDQTDIEAVRRLYLPAEERMFTPGASFEKLNWPGTEGIDYRGAVGKSSTAGGGSLRPAAMRHKSGSRGGHTWYSVRGTPVFLRPGVRMQVLVSERGNRIVATR